MLLVPVKGYWFRDNIPEFDDTDNDAEKIGVEAGPSVY